MFLEKGKQISHSHQACYFGAELKDVDAEVIDGSMLLYHAIWPISVNTLCKNYTKLPVRPHAVCVVVYRYAEADKITKSYER